MAQLVELRQRRPGWIGGRLQHQRRNGADQHGLGDTLRPVPADVASDFAATGRVTDVDRVLQIEVFDERGKIVGVRIQVVAVPRLAGAAMTAAVMGDATVAARRQEEHLVFEGVGMMAGLPASYFCIKAFSATDLTADLGKIDVPTLILHGDDDQIVPIAASAVLSAKIVKRATLKVYKGAPHGMCTTLKDQVNAELLEFIKS
jgi:pimeloyl-ACP methyl ester carboxylesterase